MNDRIEALSGALLSILLLGGCAAKKLPDVAAPIAITPTDPEVEGLDVYRVARAQNASLPSFRGENTVEVRTFVDPPGAGNRRETKGACEITGGSLYSASIETPRKIIVPNYGPQSPHITALCQIDGRAASSSVAVFNRTKRDIANSGNQAGALGVLFAAVIAEAVSDDNDVFEYPPLEVDLETKTGTQ